MLGQIFRKKKKSPRVLRRLLSYVARVSRIAEMEVQRKVSLNVTTTLSCLLLDFALHGPNGLGHIRIHALVPCGWTFSPG